MAEYELRKEGGKGGKEGGEEEGRESWKGGMEKVEKVGLGRE